MCEFCGRDEYYTLEAFREHIDEHLPQLANENTIEIIEDAKQDQFFDIYPREESATKSAIEIYTDPKWIPEIQIDDESIQFGKESVERVPNKRKRPAAKCRTAQFSTDKEVIDYNDEEINVAEKSLILITPCDDDIDRPFESRKDGFKCKFCSKRFGEKLRRNDHENSHTGRQPYKCKTCSKTFTCTSAAFTHVKLMHSHDLKHKCAVCAKPYKSPSELDIHVRSKHLDKTDPRSYFACTLCDAKFETHSRFRYHRKLKHTYRSDAITCDICQRQFKRRINLLHHMKKHI